MTWLGASLLPYDDLRAGLLPVLAEGGVDMLEWTVDGSFREVEDWAVGLLDAFSSAGRLSGHGVELSVHSLEVSAGEEAWWSALRATVHRWPLRWLTVHYGWMTAGRISRGAPLPPPPGVLDVAVERLRRLQEVVEAPVGLENLALVLHPDDARRQGDELEALLAPVDGVLLLDLHNLWCQAVNLDLDPVELMGAYPLHRVVQCHVAGGRWDHEVSPAFRRDTHDDAVPDQVWALVGEARARCPRLEAVVLERMPGTLDDPAAYTADLRRLGEVLARSVTPIPAPHLARAVTEGRVDPQLQAELLEHLLGEDPLEDGLIALGRRYPAVADWLRFEPRAADVARRLVRTWARRASIGADT